MRLVDWTRRVYEIESVQRFLFSFRYWSLRSRLIAIVLALALPLNIVILTVLWGLASAAQDAQRKSLLYTASSVSAAVDAELSKYLALAMALSRSPALFSNDLDTFEQEARRAFASVPDAWVQVADPDGQQLLNTASTTRQALPRRHSGALEQQSLALASGVPLISGVRLGPVTRRWTTTIDVPIFKDGRPYRVLAVTMTVEGFLRLFNKQELPKNWLIGIIVEQGRYISRIPDHERVVGELASEGWRLTAGRQGLFDFLSRDGDPVVNANSVSKLANWTVGIAIKKSELDAAAWRATRWAVIIGIVFSLLSLLLAVLLARRINRNLRDLRTNAQELLAGRLGSEKTPTIPELADVWHAIKSGAEDRNRSEELLRRSYDTYFRLIKNSVFGVYLIDTDFRVAEVSVGAQKIFQNVRPLIGRDFGEVLHIIWPETFSLEVIGIFRHTLATGEPYQSNTTREVRQDTADRESYDWRIERVALPDSRFGVVCYFYDLTERLQHEEHVRLLMQELNHRLKNTLGVIQAIARLTKADSLPDFLDRFNQRLQALAANQDILVQTEWRGAGLKELAHAQLATFTDKMTDRITIAGPSIVLTPAAAQNIGLALHELATNAVKYGALSNDRGSVDVVWSTSAGKLFLSWKESEGPPVNTPTQRGFGTKVIDQMVRSGLRGSVTLDYHRNGLIWCLECALDNITNDGRVG